MSAPNTPSPTPAADSFERLCLDGLKAVGKTLSQMNLYKVGHPAVMATLTESHDLITRVLGQAGEGQVTFSFDADKLIANGRIVGAAAQIPNAVSVFFARFRVGSLTFSSGLPAEELTALCEMAAMRAEQAKVLDTSAFLAERKVAHIKLNEALYAKVGEQQPAPENATATANSAEQAAQLVDKMKSSNVEDSILALVKAAVQDPLDQAKVLEAVMARLKDDIERRVTEATRTLRNEKATLEREAQRTETVLTNMAEGVVVVDDAGKILMMNPAAEEIYGTSLSEVAGKPLADAVKEEHLLSLAQQVAPPPPEGQFTPQVDVVSTDESRKVLRASSAVVQNEAGKTVGMVSVITDVTKHKELARVEREFIAHVTHELRAPLSAIRAALEILQGQFEGKLGGDDERMLGTALRNADRLNDLIRDILDFGKIESGQMTVHPEPTDPQAIAAEAVDSLKPWAQRKSINLSLDTGTALPQVNADAKRVVQIIINLLSNAIKFTPKNGGVTVSLSRTIEDGVKYVRYAVKDSGPGIAKADQEKIFQKFVQIAAGEKHVGGTGLGLAIAKALVGLHKGKMWVESDEGQGATFLFTIPFFVPPDIITETVSKVEPAKPKGWWERLFGR
ncbi:MAG: PAS domain S-box protein [Elusimicrobia bacterium]|nr:PAS domain S-box protein [Elusimicrobiota bacterium]